MSIGIRKQNPSPMFEGLGNSTTQIGPEMFYLLFCRSSMWGMCRYHNDLHQRIMYLDNEVPGIPGDVSNLFFLKENLIFTVFILISNCLLTVEEELYAIAAIVSGF